MHLAIDVREACKPERTGKGQWTYGFVTELLTRGIPLTLCTDRQLPPEWQRSFTPDSPSLRIIETRLVGLRWHFSIARFLRSDRHASAYVSPTSYIVPSLLGRRLPCIPVVHDLIAFRSEPHDRKAQLVERLTLGRAARTAAHVCTVSEATRGELLLRYPRLDAARVSAIFAGPARAVVEPNDPDERTILCVGTLCPRKNQERLIRAYGRLDQGLRDRFRLVLAGGRGWGDAGIVRLASSVPGVTWLRHVPDAELDELLRRSTVLALPSLYEGFGLAVLEAMQRGVPVLTSDRGALPEVAGDAALFVDPADEESIAKGLQSLLTDPILRQDLARRGLARAGGYSWKRTVDLLLPLLAPHHP